MPRELAYGPCLTQEEYERRILELHRNLPPLPSPEQDRQARREELELAIDHRLGRGFPKDRRAALWAVHERIEKKRVLLGLKFLLRRFVTSLFARHAASLAACVAEEYAKVLSPEELRCFLDLKEGEAPALPVDVEHLQ